MRLVRLRSSYIGWAIGLASATGVPTSSSAQQEPPAPLPQATHDPSKADDQMAFRQAIQRAVDLANREKKYSQAVEEALVAQASGRRAFGPASKEVDEALHVLQQLYNLSGDVAAELRALRELIGLRRERLGPLDWRVKDLEALLALRERVTSSPPDQVSTLDEIDRQIKEASTLEREGRLDDAVTIRKSALERWLKVMPGDTKTAAELLTDLGLHESRRHEFAKARARLEEALAVRTRLLGERHPDVAETILILARIAEADGDLARARAMFERALTIRLDISKNDEARHDRGKPDDPADPEFVDLLEQVGRLFLRIGDHKAAQVQFQRAADIRRLLADRAGDLAAMRPLGIGPGSRRPFGMRPGFHGGMREIGRFGLRPRGLGGIPNIGFDGLTDEDDVPESPTRRPPSMFGDGLDDVFGDVFPGLGGLGPGVRGGFGADNLGMPGFRGPSVGLGFDPSAIVRDPSHPWSVRERAWMMLRKENLTPRAAAGGRRDEPFMQDLEFAREMMRDESWIAYARCLRSLAIAKGAGGERDSARRMRLLAAAIGLEACDPSEETRPIYAVFLDDFVEILEEYGDLDLAESLAVWSVVYRRASFGERHAEYATGLSRLATVLGLRGDFTQATLLYDKALAVRREALPDDHPDLVEILLPAAELLRDHGDSDDAKRMAGQALAISDAFLDRALPFLPERQRLSMLALRARSASVMLDITAADRGSDVEAYSHLVPWKGITVDVAVAQRVAAGTGEVGDLRKQLAAARAELNRLYHAVVPAEKSREHARLTRAQVELSSALEGRLAQAVGWKRVGVGPIDVQNALPEGSVLIDFYQYQHRARSASSLVDGASGAGTPAGSRPASRAGIESTEGRYAVFITRRGSPTVRVELGPADPIDRDVQAWLGAIDRQKDHEPAGRRLAKTIWGPIAPFVTDASTVLVSPDGALNILPWGALPADKPGAYLLEFYAFAVVPSPRQMSHEVQRDEPSSTSAQGLLAVGGVDYQRRAPTVASENPQTSAAAAPAQTTRGVAVGAGRVVFPPLPATRDEVKAVAEVYRRSRRDPVRVMTGAEATKDRLMAAIPRHRHLLLATHGYFAPPEIQSALNAVGVPTRPTTWDEMSPQDVVGYHPGLLSGLAWAGASNPAADPDTGLIDRGAAIMTAEEVSALDLRGCDTAVLSACQTGLGLTAGGEGVLGLQRAFLQAGARTVVASLWRVDDAATYRLMEQFHTNLWIKKLPKLEALRQAQLAILNNPGFIRESRAEQAKRDLGTVSTKLPEGGSIVAPIGTGIRSSPALWAAFVLSGETR